MTPPIQDPCVQKTIVDRNNNKLTCLKGQSYRPDIWIQPNLNCPRFMSYRCTPCKCSSKPLCANYTRRVVKRWRVQFVADPTSRGGGWWCCNPEFQCVNTSTPSAPRPGICNSCVCPYGGNPEAPDPESTWDTRALIRPCPAAPLCRPGTRLIEIGIGTDGCMRYQCVSTPTPPSPSPGADCGKPGLPPCKQCITAPCPPLTRFPSVQLDN
ncbi:MAG: hypothetical protein EBU90_13710 [Proteobacteria bacterium]|nr:hypothetical protein [Pseudomonadota bacterium]